MTDWSKVKLYRCRWCGRRVRGVYGWFHDTDACFRRARRPSRSQSAGRPCGCSPPDYCPQAKHLITLLYRGRRIGNQYGEWSDHNQALVEAAIHLGREPSEVWAMLRHPVGR